MNRTTTGGDDKPAEGAGQGGIPASAGQGGIPDWGIKDKEGGSNKATWTKNPASLGSYVFACVWITLVACMPIGLHVAEHGLTAKGLTKTQLVETAVLYVWLIGGTWLFTNVLLFQSPHFNGEIRSLSLEESVYLFSQIITTVGYGDITPAKTRGQVFVGIFVVFSFLLVAGMISQFAALVLEKVQSKLVDDTPRADNESQLTPRTLEQKHNEVLWVAAMPLMQSGAVFSFFLVIGVVFFSSYPGENKTVFQAVYMSFITLSSVGFGAFTPVTRVGMVFGAFWMLFGVSSLGAVISSTGAFVTAVKKWEKGAGYGQQASRHGSKGAAES